MPVSSRLLRVFALMLVVATATGCQQMGPTEYGLRFRRLPTFLGGGVARSTIAPAQMAIVYPWDSIYRFDTSVRDVSWGGNKDGVSGVGDFVHTRALDGNEVALAVTVRYRLSTDPEALVRLLQEVATSNEEIRDLVVSVGRAEIRTKMNALRTSEFLDEQSRYAAVDSVKAAMVERLGPYGIEVLRVALDGYRFERALRDGTIDSSYQEKLTEIQKLREDTEREKLRIDTIRAKKQQEFNETQAGVNRQVAEAEGFKKQAALRGDAYYESRANEAKAITAQGKAEVEGLIEQINALSGPGSEAILKLELAKSLIKSDPKFVVLDSAGDGGGLDVKRLDTNDLLAQLGAFEALAPKEPRPARSPADGASPAPNR
jgi:hypothetical protein